MGAAAEAVARAAFVPRRHSRSQQDQRSRSRSAQVELGVWELRVGQTVQTRCSARSPQRAVVAAGRVVQIVQDSLEVLVVVALTSVVRVGRELLGRDSLEAWEVAASRVVVEVVHQPWEKT